MVRSRTPSQGGGSQGFEMERKYSVPSNPDARPFSGNASEDLHAWSIYRLIILYNYVQRRIRKGYFQAKFKFRFHGQRLGFH